MFGLRVQVLFLMYHYFNAAEMYNSIRLYIAVSSRSNWAVVDLAP